MIGYVQNGKAEKAKKKKVQRKRRRPYVLVDLMGDSTKQNYRIC